MLRKKPYTTNKNTTTKESEPKHKLVEDVTINQKTINVLKGIHHFSNLWNLSLNNCRFHNDQTASELLKPLSAFAYLGTLDLSNTDITFEWLQRYIRPLSIQHLKLYGIPEFNFDDPPCRGFLIFCLPSAWMINDQFITFAERRYWYRYYSPSAAALSVMADTHHFSGGSSSTNANNGNTTNATVGTGQYSMYMRKHYINPESLYIPTSEQEEMFEKVEDIELMKREEYEQFYNQGQLIMDPMSSLQKQHHIKAKKLWSKKAKLLMSKMPKAFYMPMEQDQWRMKVLMQQFYLQLDDEGQNSEMQQFYRENDILDYVLIHDANIYYDSSVAAKQRIRMYTEYRIILLMLLFGSLQPEFPRDVIQAALEFFFAKESDDIYEPFIHNPEAYASSKLAEEEENKNKNNAKKKHYWVEKPTSPLLWNRKLILFFIQMLISRIELESESASSFQNSNDTALIDKKTLSILKLFIYNQSTNQLNGNDMDIYGSYAYVKNTQQIYLAMFNLRLIQLLTFIPHDLFFLTHFQTLYNIYAKAILLLIPLTYLETADYNFFMSEEEMIEYLRDDGDAQTQQDLNRKQFEEEMQHESEHSKRYGINAYPNKYKFKLNDILKKKISPILQNTSKYQRLFMTSMDIHGRALELRYYLNNSIMHVFEAEEIYDETMNKLWNDMDLVVKGKKVFFNPVVVSLHELKEDTIPLEVPSTPRTVLNSMGKTRSTGNLDNVPEKLKKRTLRHRHSMRSMKSMSHYDLLAFKQRSANISRATLASAASSSTIFSAIWDRGGDESQPSMANNIPTHPNTAFMKRNTSSFLDRSIANDARLLKNIYSINETIMNTPKAQKSMAKREERRASQASAKKNKENLDESNTTKIQNEQETNNNNNNNEIKEEKEGGTEEEKEKNMPPKSRDLKILENILSKTDKENEEEETEEKTEGNSPTESTNKKSENKENEGKSNKRKHAKNGSSTTANEKDIEEGEEKDEDEDEDEDEDDENAYDDFYSSSDSSSTSSNGYGYYINPSDDKYTISQDFSIRNTLSLSKKEGNLKESSPIKSKAKKVNTYQHPGGKTKSSEPTDEDLFIDFILYHTDVAKSPDKLNQPNGVNGANGTKNNSSQSPSHTTSPVRPPLNRNLFTSQTSVNDITSQSIQYHLTHMPILGSARNYKKKNKKDDFLNQLNRFYEQGESSDSDLNLFKPTSDSNEPTHNFIVSNTSPTKKKY